jgi:hypothetical protein
MAMNMKYAICAIALAVFVTPALAGNEFHVVQDIASKKCTIMEQKPTGCHHDGREHNRIQDAGRGPGGTEDAQGCESK